MSLIFIYALFKNPSGKVVELRGQVSEDLARRLHTEVFIAVVQVRVKTATRSAVTVPMEFHSLLTSREPLRPQAAIIWATVHFDKLGTASDEVNWQYIRELCDLPAPVDTPLRERASITQSKKLLQREPGSAARYCLARAPVCLEGKA